MSNSVTVLERQAIKAAMNQDWEKAVELNEQILETEPNNLQALLRQGKAYLQLSEFTKAKKLFKEVLKHDPINQIAKKNYEMASNKKVAHSSNGSSRSKIIIKEPGTTADFNVKITAARITADSFVQGDSLELKVLKAKTKLISNRNNKDIEVAELDDHVSKKLYMAKEEGANLSAKFIDGKDKFIKVLIKSSLPIFKGQKQEVKPYVKQSSSMDELE